jgi:hypothetical protein
VADLASVAFVCKCGKRYVLAVRPEKLTRSIRANAYLWAVCYAAIADHTGYTVEEVHEYCKRRWLPKHLAIAGRNGELVGEDVIGGSTAELDTHDFAEYVTKIKAWALDDLGVYIPEAGEKL